MNRDTDRCAFQVAWSEHDGAYVGTAPGFPMLSHRSATAQGALAGIEQLVADARGDHHTDEKPPYANNETHCPAPCLVCGKTLEPSLADDMQPNGGVTLHIFGNYGSQVFDPSGDANWLQACLCDSCLRSAITAQRILHAWRPHAIRPQPTYRIATSHNIIGIIDDPHLM